MNWRAVWTILVLVIAFFAYDKAACGISPCATAVHQSIFCKPGVPESIVVMDFSIGKKTEDATPNSLLLCLRDGSNYDKRIVGRVGAKRPLAFRFHPFLGPESSFQPTHGSDPNGCAVFVSNIEGWRLPRICDSNLNLDGSLFCESLHTSGDNRNISSQLTDNNISGIFRCNGARFQVNNASAQMVPLPDSGHYKESSEKRQKPVRASNSDAEYDYRPLGDFLGGLVSLPVGYFLGLYGGILWVRGRRVAGGLCLLGGAYCALLGSIGWLIGWGLGENLWGLLSLLRWCFRW